MTPHELQTQALALPTADRWQLTNALRRSLQSPAADRPKGLAASLIGIAKTDSPAPTDDEVAAMLDERLAQKYL
jgi:hypothetical protein